MLPRMVMARAPRHATGTIEFVPLTELSDDATFRVRPVGDVARLAVSIGRLGQLFPVEVRPLPGAAAGAPGPRWQVVSGFRRVEALRMLQRQRVLARVHADLPDEDAWDLALAGPLFSEPWKPAELEGLRPRVRARMPWAEGDLPGARGAAAPSSPPSSRPTPVPLDDLARRLAVRVWEVNQEMADALEAWRQLPAPGRRHLVEQLRYLAEIYPAIARETE